MRPKLILFLLLLAGALAAAFVLFRQPSTPASSANVDAQADQAPPATEQSTAPVSSSKTQKAPDVTRGDKELATLTAAGVTNANELSPEERHQAYVEARTAELSDLGFEEDADSLNNILSDLTNPDEDIRDAAREAAVQFGSKDAIPALTLALQQLDDVDERTKFKEAIDFLKLPSINDTNRAPGSVENQTAK